MLDTLVLSSGYEPLRPVSWKKAVSWLIAGRVEVLEEYEDRFVHSVGQTYKVPRIIRFIGKAVRRWMRRGIRFTRENVWLRDHGKCQYCDRHVPLDGYEYEHVKPRSHGGKTDWRNIVVACSACNSKKRNRTPEQAGMFLKQHPFVPKSLPGVSAGGDKLIWSEGMPLSWKEWLDAT